MSLVGLTCTKCTDPGCADRVMDRGRMEPRDRIPCAICHHPMERVTPTQTCHPTCDPSTP